MNEKYYEMIKKEKYNSDNLYKSLLKMNKINVEDNNEKAIEKRKESILKKLIIKIKRLILNDKD